MLLGILIFFSVKVAAQTCNPDFSFQFTTATIVKFNPAIVNDSPLVQHWWIFGDGSPSTTQISPSHTYVPGVYVVKHIVLRSNSAGAQVCGDTLLKTITVAAQCNLSAGFTFQQSNSNQLEFHFTNTSVNFAAGDSIRWNFGDGTVSYDLNPTHVYTAPGTYNVCIRVQRVTPAGTSPCVSELCHTVTIAGTPGCNIHPTYTHTADSLHPKKIYFTNTTQAANSSTASWSFGDGSSASTWNSVHEYSLPGRYYVCLTIHDGNCVTSHCDSLTVIPNTSACSMQVFPNPASTVIHATAYLNAPTVINAYIYNSSQIQVRHKEQQGIAGNNVVEINIQTLPSGIYTFKLVYNGHTCTATFLK